MNYETKFNVGDIVWIMYNNRPESGTVSMVQVTKNATNIGGEERVCFMASGQHRNELAANLFHTKQALIESI